MLGYAFGSRDLLGELMLDVGQWMIDEKFTVK
jgi:hypothetical protein